MRCKLDKMPFLRSKLHMVIAEARRFGPAQPVGSSPSFYVSLRAGFSVRETDHCAAVHLQNVEHDDRKTTTACVWNQAFQLRILDSCEYVHIHLRSKRPDGVDDLVGKATLSIRSYFDGVFHDDWVPLLSVHAEDIHGEQDCSKERSDPRGCAPQSDIPSQPVGSSLSGTASTGGSGDVQWRVRVRARHQSGFLTELSRAFFGPVDGDASGVAETAEEPDALLAFAASSDSETDTRGPMRQSTVTCAAQAFSPRRVLAAYDELRSMLVPAIAAMDAVDALVGCVDGPASAAAYAVALLLWIWSPPLLTLLAVVLCCAIAFGFVQSRLRPPRKRTTSRQAFTPLPGDTSAGVKLSCIVSKDRSSSIASDSGSTLAISRSGSFRLSRAAGEPLLTSGDPETERFVRVMAKVQLLLRRIASMLASAEDVLLWRAPRTTMFVLALGLAAWLLSLLFSMYDLGFGWITCLFALNTRAADHIIAGARAAGEYARCRAPVAMNGLRSAMRSKLE